MHIRNFFIAIKISCVDKLRAEVKIGKRYDHANSSFSVLPSFCNPISLDMLKKGEELVGYFHQTLLRDKSLKLKKTEVTYLQKLQKRGKEDGFL